MNRLAQIEAILELFVKSSYPLVQYKENKPTIFFLDRKNGVMIATLYEVNESRIDITQSRVANDEDVDDESLAAYYHDAKQILWSSHMENQKNALLNHYLQESIAKVSVNPIESGKTA